MEGTVLSTATALGTLVSTEGAVIYEHKRIRKKREKVAVFDVDWTLIKPKEGRRFPKEVSDWQWLRPSVPVVVRRFHRNGYRIVFLTDQTKDWKVDMIKMVCGELDVPIVAIIAMKKELQKPNDQLFKSLVGGDYNWKESIYVGDAAGREGDWADVDKKVAEKIGVRFLTPEEVFPLPAITERHVAGREKEVVIMVGYPGAGKSTVARGLVAGPVKYHLVEGDAVGGTVTKMLQAGEQGLREGASSIIFDATNGTREKRRTFLEFAQKHGLGVRCVWVDVGIDVAMEQNKERGGKLIPDVVFYTFRKRFEAPTKEECEIVIVK